MSFRVAVLSLGALMLVGCAGFGNAVGGGKNPPDEFAITTKAPLVVPPDYSLRPPEPGAARPQEVSPSQRAQQLILGDTTAAPPTLGERALLQRTKAQLADANIRALLDDENGDRADKDESFANQLLFWNFLDGKVDDTAAPLRVDDPEAWLAAREQAIESVIGEEAKVTIKKDDRTLGLPGVF